MDTLARPKPTRIPISSLLPPPLLLPSPSSPAVSAGPSYPLEDPASMNDDRQIAGPSTRYLPLTSYILGPTPRTSPFHLALNYLSRADIDHSPRRHNATLKSAQGVSEYDEIGQLGETGKPNSEGKGKGRAAGQSYPEPDLDPDSNRQVHLLLPIDCGGLRAGERVLIVSGSRGDTIDQLVEEDEDWLRNYGGHFQVLQKLRRIDMRYCPTPAHLNLLLTLLSESTERIPSRTDTAALPQLVPLPSVVVLHDIAGLFMVDEEADENEPPPRTLHQDEGRGEDSAMVVELGGPSGLDKAVEGDQIEEKDERSAETSNRKQFKEGICLSDYMDVLSAAKAAIDHLSNLHPSEPPVQLIILEPNLTSTSSLPILPPLNSENEDPKMSRMNRERRIKILDGAGWLFGRSSVGVIEPSAGAVARDGHQDITRYTFIFGDGDGDGDGGEADAYGMIKRPCSRALTAKRGLEDGFVEADDRGGWRWEWA
ncbi:hypothetical protein IAT40_006237 [Kwoniella sp. CBS 6097]